MKPNLKIYTQTLIGLFLLMAPLINNISAQTFCNRYGGPGAEYAYQLIEDPDGNYVMTGRTYSFPNYPLPYIYSDIYTIKFNPSFDIVWTSVFQTPKEDEGNAIVNAHDSGYLIAGASYDSIRGYDITLVKLDTGGNVQWSKLLGTPLNDQAEVLIPVSDNEYIIGGYSDSTFSVLAQSFVPFIARISNNGSVLWARRFGFPTGAFSGSVYDIIEAQDGSILVTGDIIRLFDGPDDSDIFIARFSSSGNLLWFKWMGLNCQGCQEMGAKLIEDGPQRFTLFGSSSTTWSLYICSFDINGNILHETGLNTGTFAYTGIDAVKTSPDKTILTCPGYNNILVAAIDTLHQVIWSSTYGAVQGSTPCSILKRGTGYVLAGQSGWQDPFQEDYFIAVLDSMGYSCCMIKEQPVTTSSLQFQDSSGGTASPFILMEYYNGQNTTGGVKRVVCSDLNSMQEKSPAAKSVWPNPFTDYLYISLDRNGSHNVKIHDQTGKLMYNNTLNGSIRIPTFNWPAGIYSLVVDGVYWEKIIRLR